MSKDDRYFAAGCPVCGSRQATVKASYRGGDTLYQELACRHCYTVYTAFKEHKKED